jgi:hypothetical protein
MSPASVAHAYNPSYSGSRDQKDCDLKPVWANSLWDPISKKILHKNRAGGVAQDVGPDFKPQHHKKKGKWMNVWDFWRKCDSEKHVT